MADRWQRSSLTLGALLAALVVGTVCPRDSLGAAPIGAKKKIPSPQKQLLTAYKNLLKQKSYRSTLTVEGGLSRTKDHDLYQKAVSATYNGEVYRNLLHVTNMKSFKTGKKGVRYIQGGWRSIHADRQGKMLDSFFKFPQDVLRQALRHVKRSGKWVEPAADDEAADEDDDDKGKGKGKGKGKAKGKDRDKDEAKNKSKGKGKGRTAVGEKRGSKGDDDVRVPRVLLVEAPIKEALEHYLTVEKSGCLGGG